LLAEIEAAWDEALEGLDWICIELDEVHEWVPDLMSFWGLASYDAVHVATAMYTAAGAVVTLDRHFGHVPEAEFELYVPTAALRGCRDRRRRAR
jgi:predicted nucleic acid-binding protein